MVLLTCFEKLSKKIPLHVRLTYTYLFTNFLRKFVISKDKFQKQGNHDIAILSLLF